MGWKLNESYLSLLLKWQCLKATFLNEVLQKVSGVDELFYTHN